jgi:hypothetical protein
MSSQPVNNGLIGVDDEDDNSQDEGDEVQVSVNSGGGSSSDSDLINLKKQALEELLPLVDHLDQTPEEKFKTTMMMIQATDDKSLVPSAFAAAKAIKDDKVRAQALLDIVNEINYFTQKA